MLRILLVKREMVSQKIKLYQNAYLLTLCVKRWHVISIKSKLNVRTTQKSAALCDEYIFGSAPKAPGVDNLDTPT
jgi:hypothetical protein